MKIRIDNPSNGRFTVYTPAELARDARHVARVNKAKMVEWFVSFNGDQVSLVVYLRGRDGWVGSHSQAI